MAALINTIGVISGLMTMFSFTRDSIPEPELKTSVVAITVGLDYDGGLKNAGGSLPDVRLFNEAGKFIGMKVERGKVSSGSTEEIKITHDDSKNGQQAAYALLSANDDAICIAYMTITWANGDKYAWVGDWGSECGSTWYYSNVYVQNSSRKPNCMWIDANGDQPQTGFQLHWPEFVAQNASEVGKNDKKVRDKLCSNGPAFKILKEKDPRGIIHWVIDDEKRSLDEDAERSVGLSQAPQSWVPRGRQGLISARNQTTTSGADSRFVDRLVLDDDVDHSTSRLCESENSLGPDFANRAEGLFCRMSDKTMWPICSEAAKDNCFNIETKQLIIGGVTTRDSPYSVVSDWTTGN